MNILPLIAILSVSPAQSATYVALSEVAMSTTVIDTEAVTRQLSNGWVCVGYSIFKETVHLHLSDKDSVSTPESGRRIIISKSGWANAVEGAILLSKTGKAILGVKLPPIIRE